MKIKILIIVTIISSLFLSCASTQVTVPENKNDEQFFAMEIIQKKIELLEQPSDTTKGKAFNKSYKIKLTDTNTQEILANYPIIISYPVSKTEVKTENVKTDENGIYTFTPAVPDFVVKGEFRAYLNLATKKEHIINLAKEAGIKADFNVKSDLPKKGAILFIWEYDEKQKPSRNFYNLISEIQKQGSTKVGNAPINDESDIGKPVENLWKRNKEIVNDDFGYLIIGTVKYEKAIEKTDDGWYCKLLADIQIVDMTDGKVIYTNSYSCDTVQPKWEKAASTCKEKLGKIIADDIIYAL